LSQAEDNSLPPVLASFAGKGIIEKASLNHDVSQANLTYKWSGASII
jgi:hypothetical protein